MIRGDNIVCGTTSTGTGTLTLAATPASPGGIDFDVFARATGVGFGNSAVILVSYTIIEYVDSTFASAKSHEKGVGTLTLGGSSGIANATLARTTKQTSATSLNSPPATQNIAPVTGISIGTAANTLVFIGPSVADIQAFLPYIQTAAGENAGAGPATACGPVAFSTSMTSGLDHYFLFSWQVPMLVKNITIRTASAALSGATATVFGAIYAIGTDGKPGKLLIDFGQIGNGTSLNATFNPFASANSGTFFLIPGEYYCDISLSWTSGTGSVTMVVAPGILNSGRGGTVAGTAIQNFTATGARTAGAAPDPANITGWALDANQTSYAGISFMLSP